MKPILLILSVLTFTTLKAQIEREFASALTEMSFRKIDSIKQLEKTDSSFRISYSDYSDIISGYQAGYLNISYGQIIENGILAQVKYIRFNEILVYYDLRNESNLYFYHSSNFSKYLAPVKLYTFHKDHFSKLQKLFQNFYDVNFNLNECFELQFYSDGCGIDGEVPANMNIIDSLVKFRDKVSLKKWLQSSNSTKQIYGVNGFYKLKKIGVPIENTELKLIRQIINKSGVIRTCSGCFFDIEPIKEVSKEFNF